MALVDDISIVPHNWNVTVTSPTLDAVEEHAAGVFPVPKTGTLKKIGWRNASSLVGTIALSLETVADTIGVPVATTDAGKTLYAALAVSADIVNPTTGVRFDQINGTTGIAVTKGDLISVVVRAKAVTSGVITVSIQSTNLMAPSYQMPYTYTYLGGASAASSLAPQFTLEYDGEFVPIVGGWAVQPAVAAETFNSGSNPDRRGLKFRFLVKKQLQGAYFYIDTDEDVQVILYDADEYTVMSGFPITIQGNQRRVNSQAIQYVEFPTEPTCLASTYYRLVLLPTTVTNIAWAYSVPSDDGAVLGMTAIPGGLNFVKTTFNGAPTSGSHAWTDTTTQRPGILLVASKTDAGAGGGLLVHPGMSGARG